MKKELIKCNAVCWCEFCGKKINKEEPYLYLWKNAWRGSTRFNICILCLNELSKYIPKDKLKELKIIKAEQQI